MFYLVLPSTESRQRLIDQLKGEGILSVFHYMPLHTSPMGERMGGRQGDCPIAEDISERLVRLPFYNGLTEEDLATVVSAIKSVRFAGQRRSLVGSVAGMPMMSPETILKKRPAAAPVRRAAGGSLQLARDAARAD
jgi:hypothetical protein